MKTIKIAHLYYDLMNLYGEQGNVIALTAALKKQGLKYTVDLLTKDDVINFSKYDILVMGQGSEANQEIVRKDILKYKKDIKKVISKKTFIMTGNAYELFGSSINDLEALGIFPFKTTRVKTRIIGEQVYKTSLLDRPIIGFQNRSSINDNASDSLFEVIQGNGNDNNNIEGIKVNNFYGTYTLGPLLIRNPHLTDLIIKNILDEKNCPYKEIIDTPDYQAYEEYLKNFNINI